MTDSTVREVLTLETYDMIKHMLGYDRKKVKYKKYTYHRNYFFTYKSIEAFDKLVEGEYMSKREDGLNNEGFVYHLTEKGINFISIYERVKLVELD